MHHENVEASVGDIDNFVDFYCHIGTHERIMIRMWHIENLKVPNIDFNFFKNMPIKFYQLLSFSLIITLTFTSLRWNST